jgi:transposase-like protein
MESNIEGFKQYFYHQTVTTKQIEDYLSKQAGIDLSMVLISI